MCDFYGDVNLKQGAAPMVEIRSSVYPHHTDEFKEHLEAYKTKSAFGDYSPESVAAFQKEIKMEFSHTEYMDRLNACFAIHYRGLGLGACALVNLSWLTFFAGYRKMYGAILAGAQRCTSWNGAILNADSEETTDRLQMKGRSDKAFMARLQNAHKLVTIHSVVPYTNTLLALKEYSGCRQAADRNVYSNEDMPSLYVASQVVKAENVADWNTFCHYNHHDAKVIKVSIREAKTKFMQWFSSGKMWQEWLNKESYRIMFQAMAPLVEGGQRSARALTNHFGSTFLLHNAIQTKVKYRIYTLPQYVFDLCFFSFYFPGVRFLAVESR